MPADKSRGFFIAGCSLSMDSNNKSWEPIFLGPFVGETVIESCEAMETFDIRSDNFLRDRSSRAALKKVR